MSRSAVRCTLLIGVMCVLMNGVPAVAQSATEGQGSLPPGARATAKPLDSERLVGVQRIAARILKDKAAQPPTSDDERAVSQSLEALRASIISAQATTLSGARAVTPLGSARDAGITAKTAADAPDAKIIRDSIATLKTRYAEFARRRDRVARPDRYAAMLQKVQAVEADLESLQALDSGTRAARLSELAQRLVPHKLSDEVAPMSEPTLSTNTQHRRGPGREERR